MVLIFAGGNFLLENLVNVAKHRGMVGGFFNDAINDLLAEQVFGNQLHNCGSLIGTTAVLPED